MLRLIVVTVGASCVALAGALHQFPLASVIGIVLGVIYLAISLGKNDGLVNASLRKNPDRPNDPNAGISMGLGASGIAATAVTNEHYPATFRVFFAVCFVGGLLIAEYLAIRHRSDVVLTSGVPDDVKSIDTSLDRAPDDSPG